MRQKHNTYKSYAIAGMTARCTLSEILQLLCAPDPTPITS